MRAAGLRAAPGENVEQPFFSVQGRMITIGGEDVQVFSYPDTASAEAEAGRVSRDGTSVGNTTLHWIGAPHFYKKGELVVLYLGDEKQVLSALDRVLGPQFAGR